MSSHHSRREFLRTGTVVGGGLLLAGTLGGQVLLAQAPPAGAPPGGAPPAGGTTETLSPLVFVKIEPDGAIRIFSARPDIGQGIKTSSAMIVAEELDADWSKVTVEQSPVDAAVYGQQSVGGSRSTLVSWDPLRRCGAAARAMLVSAAAQVWKVNENECTTDKSVVTHWPSRRTLGYGELASRAAALPVPDASKLPLKNKREYKLVGTRVASVDNRKIVTGQPQYGMDVQLPDMRYVAIARAPRRGATVYGANIEEVKRMPGVSDVFVVTDAAADPNDLLPGVAVVANSTWNAFRARDALKIQWDESKAADDSWSSYEKQARELAGHDGAQVVRQTGDVGAAFKSAAKTIDAFYTYPFLSHTPLEPQNTTAWLRDGTLEMWCPVQTVDRARPTIAKVMGLPLEKVVVHLPRVGGGFGRRLVWDYMLEAAVLSKRVQGPFKLVWSREDDMRFDYYRPGGFHSMKAALDAKGRLTAWQDHFITFSSDGKSPVGVGVIEPNDFPVPVLENTRLSQSLLPLATRTGAFRAPRSNGLAFPMQSFLHEISTAAGFDHVQFLLDLFGAPRLIVPGSANSIHAGRAAGVIRLAAQKAGWGRKLAPGRGMGMAFYYSHSGHVAEVVELSVSKDKKLTVHRVVVAADIGIIVNQLGFEQQAQGAVMDGLSVTLGQRITMERGAVEQRNFGDYPMMRINAAPKVETYFVDSDIAPTGFGEPALPPVAPAICNAIFAATGERVRTLPLSLSGYHT
jgi:isoquinoline 1-oxidoreductase beta subunit